MAATRIQATECPVGDIFSDEYHFSIPRYQRPYAWSAEQGGEGRSDQENLRPGTTVVRDLDQPFFQKFIQDQEGLGQLEAANNLLSDSQRNLVQNALLFDERLGVLGAGLCERLAEFVDRHTYLVVVSTQDFESAYRIFSVLNERGLDLTHTDILKSEIIGAIPEPEQEIYTKKWETEEEDLGRQDFADLFAHIRMVYAKIKARESILKEFRAHVLSRVTDGRAFVDDILVPHSDAFEVVTRADYKATTGADDVNDLLRWLNLLDNFDWIPPAISYLSNPTVNPLGIQRFLRDLERLAASLLLRRADVTRRIERYGRILNAIEHGLDLYGDDAPLQLSTEERQETLERLGADIYTVTRVRQYVLLRLDSALSSGGASYDHPIITVEHVLPQTPADGSQWRRWFSDEERERWVHKLANLVLLTRRKNSQASNYEFEVKKEKYFATREGISPFVLTTQVLVQNEWTPTMLQARQSSLASVLANLWRL